MKKELQKTSDIDKNIMQYFRRYASRDSGNGDVYTPKEIVQLMVKLCQPSAGTIYDPCCGSGALLIGAADYVSEIKDINLYGQCENRDTYCLCKINLFLRNLEANLEIQDDKDVLKDLQPGLKADYILLNPPFNQNNWGKKYLRNDQRWRYGIPPEKNANFAWLQHAISHMTDNGKIVTIMPNGAMFSKMGNEKIRAAIIEDDLIECVITLPGNLFFNTKVPCSIWILSRKKARKGNILFIDARDTGSLSAWKRVLGEDDVYAIISAYTNFKNEDIIDIDIPYAIATMEDVANQGYDLSPVRYIKYEYKKYNEAEHKKSLEQLKENVDRLIGEKILSDNRSKKLLDDINLKAKWSKRNLTDLYEVFGGVAKKGKENYGHGSPFLNLKTIINNFFVPYELDELVNSDKYEKYTHSIKSGDVFLSRTSEDAGQLALSCVALKDYSEATFNAFSKRLRPIDDMIDSKYAAAYFRSDFIRQTIKNMVYATTRATLNNDMLSRMPIIFPPKDEQIKIGELIYQISLTIENDKNLSKEDINKIKKIQQAVLDCFISEPIYSFLQRGELNL
ncbi:MAG: N-6 DNA methylase [Oscillospiraceae bacterium]|nr:N-6 DNA methylase [Oscillospiraceae bacterium]